MPLIASPRDRAVNALRDKALYHVLEPRLAHLVHHGREEAFDEELAGSDAVEAAGHEIEQFFLVDAADRRGMAAADVVGPDLEVRHRVDLRFVAEQQDVLPLVADAALGPLLDPDEAAVDRLGRLHERAAGAELGMRARGEMADFLE